MITTNIWECRPYQESPGFFLSFVSPALLGNQANVIFYQIYLYQNIFNFMKYFPNIFCDLSGGVRLELLLTSCRNLLSFKKWNVEVRPEVGIPWLTVGQEGEVTLSHLHSGRHQDSPRQKSGRVIKEGNFKI